MKTLSWRQFLTGLSVTLVAGVAWAIVVALLADRAPALAWIAVGLGLASLLVLSMATALTLTRPAPQRQRGRRR